MNARAKAWCGAIVPTCRCVGADARQRAGAVICDACGVAYVGRVARIERVLSSMREFVMRADLAGMTAEADAVDEHRRALEQALDELRATEAA